MSIPVLLNVEKSKHKRAKSDDRGYETKRFIDDDTDDDTTADSLAFIRSPKTNLALIVIILFGIGFSVRKILPPLQDTLVVQLSDEPTSSPSIRPFRHDDYEPTVVFDDTPDALWSYDISTPSAPDESWSYDVSTPSVLDVFQTEDLSLEKQVRLLPPPDISNEDVMALYSQKTYQRLHDKLHPNKPFRILINGGSSSAGGGNVDYNDAFFVRFANEMETKYDVVTDIVNRAHGDRTSMHSAILGESFFVPHVDLVIWEFSINDERDGATGVRNELILWLHKLVDIYEDEPPMVLLVYLWNKPFSTDKQGKILSGVYDYHAHLGAEFDFVLGHVNLAAYMDSLDWKADDLAQYFLADATHPNSLAHAAIAKIMVDFVSEKLEPISHNIDSGAEFEWNCGDDMREQWQIQEIFEGGLGGMAKAGFTAEVPRTTGPILPGMLEPHKEYSNGTVDHDYQLFSTQRYGVAKPGRIDRHRGLTLPCCHDGKLIFELSEQAPVAAVQFLLHAKEGVDGGNLGRRRLSGFNPASLFIEDIEILINDQDYTGRIISAHDWDCLLSNELFSTWIVLDDKDRVFPDRVSFCSKSSSCGSAVHTLEHLVVF